MAKFSVLKPFILFFEGGYAIHPKDPGGHTNKGITLDTFRAHFGKQKTLQDLINISDQQWDDIFINDFWNKCGADNINSQSVANAFVDWVWHSGPAMIKKVQKIAGVNQDGIVGPKTIQAINQMNPLSLFSMINAQRAAFLRSLKNFDSFGKGWMNRINAIKFGELVYNGQSHPCKE